MNSVNPISQLNALENFLDTHSQSLQKNKAAASPFTKTWNWKGKKVALIYDPNDGLKGLVRDHEGDTEVSKEWIKGIPHEIKSNPKYLQKFLEDTYIRLGISHNKEYSIDIKGRLRGGVNERRLKRDVIEQIREAIDHAKESKGKHVTALIGVTGSGKSTAINFLLGKKMKFVGGKVYVEDGEEEVAKIGRAFGKSTTRFAQGYARKNCQEQNRAFTDCGGFLDTRGVSTDIAVTTSTRLSLENAESVNIILCCSASILGADHGVYLAKTVGLVLGTLLKNFKNHMHSFMLMVTHPQPVQIDKDHMRQFNVGDARGLLEELAINQIDGSPLKDLFTFLIRDNGKYICVCNPGEPSSRNDILSLIDQEMEPIYNPASAFNVGYSAEAQMILTEEMTTIAAIGRKLFSDYFLHARELKRCTDEKTVLDRRIDVLKKGIEAINGKASPTEAKKIEDAMIEEQNKVITEETRKIADINRNVQEVSVKLNEVKSKKQMLEESFKGKEVLAYSEIIDKPARTYTTTETTVEVKNRKGLKKLYKNPKITKYDTETEHVLETEKDFYYSGAEISRVEKEPKEVDCWSEEVRSDKEGVYRVNFNSGTNKHAFASVKIYVKASDVPSNVTSLAAFDQEIAGYQTQLRDLTSGLSTCKQAISRAELVIKTKENSKERLNAFEQSLKELEESLGKVTEGLGRSKSGRETTLKLLTGKGNVNDDDKEKQLLEQGKENREDFDFLIEYLNLSNDKALKEKDVVTSFLKLESEFKKEVPIA